MPNAILCITGSELTRGETRDLNGPFLATALTMLGLRVDEIRLIPDSRILLGRTVKSAISCANVVILSGGLGPTADDLTVAVLAELLDKPVRRHSESENRMRERAIARGLTADKIPANYYKQAEVVDGADVLLNSVGLAPGMAIATERGLLFVLPGVPRELEAMYRQHVVERILKRFELKPPRILRAKVLGMGESWVEAKVQKAGIDFRRVEYGISAQPGEILLKFIAHAQPSQPYIDEVRRLLESEFAREIIFLPEGLTDAAGGAVETEISALVHHKLLQAGVTLATAESCTGGAVAKLLTDHAGASKYFVGSVVAYEDSVKERVLGVPPELLAAHGAVSREVCAAMARGALRLFRADLALAVTGIAGPGGGSPEKSVGLVFIGLAARVPGAPEAETAVHEHRFSGSREAVRRAAAARALDLVRRKLEGASPAGSLQPGSI